MSKVLDLKELYDSNKSFKDYVDRYAKANGLIFPEEAFKHEMVKNAYEYYISKGDCNESDTSKNKDILCNQCDRDA